MSETTLVNCSVLDVRAVRKGRLIALADVELEIEGVALVIKGVRIFKFKVSGETRDFAGVSGPQFRDAQGVWRESIQLPPEVESLFADVVIKHCNDLGITDCHRTIADFGAGAPQEAWQPK